MELKALLQKATTANASYKQYIAALEAEIAIWRSGGTVDKSEWAASGKPGDAAAAAAPKKAIAQAPRSPTPSSSRSMTPAIPAVDSLRAELHDSRPQTPTVVGMDKDEREEFLRRENELSDQLAEKELILTTANKLVGELKEELAFLKEQDVSLSQVRYYATLDSIHAKVHRYGL